MIGQCCSFNDNRGFGFVAVPDIVNEKQRFFVHHSSIQRRCLVTRKTFPNNRALRDFARRTGQKYSPAKSRLHTGEYVRFETDGAPVPSGKSVRASRVFPLTEGGTLICDHIDMVRPPRYVSPVGPVGPAATAARPTAPPEELGAAPKKISFAQVVVQSGDAVTPIIENANWGDIASDVPGIP